MKKIIAFAFLFFVINRAFAQSEIPYTVKTYPSKEVKNLEVNTSGGGILVEGGSDVNTKVEVYITGNNGKNSLSKAEIEERLDNYILSYTHIGNTLKITAKTKNNNMNWRNSLSISYKIYTSKNIDTELRTSGGGINLKNLKGNLNFQTSGGGLNLANLSGMVNGKTSGGGINLVDCNENVSLSTSGGGISAKNSAGNIKLRTSGGGLRLENMKGKIDASTSGGGIDIAHVSGELITSTSGGSIKLDDVAGNISASTSGGSIAATISSIDNYVTLKASSGNIKVDLPLSKGMNLDIAANKVSHATFADFDGEIERDRILGKLNGGGPRLISKLVLVM